MLLARAAWTLTIVLAASAAAIAAPQQSVDYAEWDDLLRRYVTSGLVNYSGLQNERAVLDRYLTRLQRVDATQLVSQEERLAFWINAYNANVVKGVLDHYPMTSVKEVKSFFNRIRYRVAGRDLTLNEIEGEGRALGDWRIHFAVVCAATGCPLLRSEAYVPDRVGAQLDEQVSRYLVDDVHGMRIDAVSKTLWVSKIFTWYAKDFVAAGPLAAKSLWVVIGGFVPQHTPRLPVPEQFSLKFLDYDWTLNDLAHPEGSFP